MPEVEVHLRQPAVSDQYILFNEIASSPSGKTKVVAVVSKRSGEMLGRIQWYGPWRQYAFYALPGTVWNPDCLDAVSAKIRELMAERRPS